MAVTAVSFQATLNAQSGKVSDVPEELRLLVYGLNGVLLVISATTLVAVALLSDTALADASARRSVPVAAARARG